MVSIIAEITAGQGHIALLAGGLGDPEDVALAAKRLKVLTPLFSKSDPPGALMVPATWPAVVQLRATFGDDLHVGPALQAWIAREVERRTAWTGLAYEVPAGLTPYSWQISGAQMIAATGKALITDEPGTGKTITAILGIVEWYQYGAPSVDELRDTPVVVICPASVIDSWVTAWEAWAPGYRVVAWRGPKRKALAGTADVYVTSYETARIDAPAAGAGRTRPLLDLAPAALVIDECHLIKNKNSQRSLAVRRLSKSAACVVALSGTPITHHPGDLWPALDAMDHDAWPSSERWINRYCEVVPGEYDDEVIGLNRATEAEFRLTLLGQHRRVAKADVLTQLPPKTYSVRTVDLPTSPNGGWRKVYDDFESTMLAELPAGPDGQTQELSVMDAMSMFTHLSRLASSAADVEVTFGPDVDEMTGQPKRHVHLDLKAPSWKVDALLEVLDERPDQQVVAFAPSSQLVKLAGAAAAAAGLRVGYIVGGQSAGDRTRTVEAFQAGQLDLVCVTTGAGGVGLTLTAARTVVFLQRPWSLVESIQAEDRCHRIGSEIHDSIEVIDVVARNTIDTRVRAVLRERAGQLADLVQDPRIVAELLGGSRATTTERKSA